MKMVPVPEKKQGGGHFSVQKQPKKTAKLERGWSGENGQDEKKKPLGWIDY